MKKIILLAGLFCLVSTLGHLNAQSINNRNWKSYIGDPLYDTITLHIRADSSFVTNSRGETMVRNNCTVSGDTLAIADYFGGEYACPDMKGVYKFILEGKSLTLKLINDPCVDRSHVLDGLKWTE
jgi:hypothetical protein